MSEPSSGFTARDRLVMDRLRQRIDDQDRKLAAQDNAIDTLAEHVERLEREYRANRDASRVDAPTPPARRVLAERELVFDRPSPIRKAG